MPPVTTIVAYLALVATATTAATPPSSPNLVWFLTDDQDQMLGGSFPQLNGGVGPMPKTKIKMANKGSTAENFYIHTPICNPSRNELLSGRYFHNIKTTGTKEWAMHVNETIANENSFVRDLHEQGGYHTGMFGKYMNVMPSKLPVGWDAWMANGGGDYIAPQFQMYNVEGLVPGMVPDKSAGTKCWGGKNHEKDTHYGCFTGTNDPTNYSTSVIGNVSMAWIRKVVQEDASKPFFAYIAPKAAHEPFNPAPWYEGHWDDSWPQQEPRHNPAWNCSAESRQNHHGNIATNPMLTKEASDVITGVFQNRWRTLMSVDDVINDVIDLCEELGVADNTYFFYSSDHGFQLGEFNMLMDKRHVYEWNTKIHLLARGPGIPAGSTWSQPATQVDMAPTFLALAGVPIDAERFDGKSLVPLLKPHEPNATMYANAWRDHVFVEYYYVEPNNKCVDNCSAVPPDQQYPHRDADCGDLTPEHNAVCWGGNLCNEACYPTESPANNFIGLRFMPGAKHSGITYAEFQTGNQINGDIAFQHVDFVEMYNNTEDQWQMDNLIPKNGAAHEVAFQDGTSPVGQLHALLHQWYNCKGSTCL